MGSDLIDIIALFRTTLTHYIIIIIIMIAMILSFLKKKTKKSKKTFNPARNEPFFQNICKINSIQQVLNLSGKR